MKFRPKSIRLRLTLWYSLILAAILGVFSFTIYGMMRHTLYSDIDRQLREDTEAIEESLEEWINVKDTENSLESSVARIGDSYSRPWLVEAWSDDGRILRSLPPHAKQPIGPPGEECRQAGIVGAILETADDLHMRVLCSEVIYNNATIRVRVARSAERVYAELRELLHLIAISLPIALLFTSLGGYWLSRKALSPIDRMSRQAKIITAEKLGEKITIENPDDELGRLAAVFNETFGRIDHSFEQMKRFTSDASHELRTPLTIIRSIGELTLKQNEKGGDHGEAIASMLEETDRLQQLVESLLTLSRADAGAVHAKLEDASICDLVQGVCSQLSVLAEEKGQRIQSEFQPGVHTQIDRLLFKQCISNLLDNAIKYSPDSSEIRVSVAYEGVDVVIEVEDQGPGIPSEHRERIFDRFYRIDKGRSRNQGGTGLGLAISKWAIEAQGGQLSALAATSGGALFRITIPQTSRISPA